MTLPDFPLGFPEPYEPYEEPYEELDPAPAYERCELEPYEDDATRADEPPYCTRPDPYEDRDPYIPEPYEEPP